MMHQDAVWVKLENFQKQFASTTDNRSVLPLNKGPPSHIQLKFGPQAFGPFDALCTMTHAEIKARLLVH